MLSRDQTRALAVRAQGFGEAYARPVDVLRRIGTIQLDSVNYLARSHELTVFSRFGPYAPDALHREMYEEKEGFEYWGHSASWLPYQDYPLFLHRAERLRRLGRGATTVNADSRDEHAALYESILQRITREGRLGAADFKADKRTGSGWWNYKPAKQVLEDLFDQGVLMCATRSGGFARVYDLAERVLPAGTDTKDPGTAAAVKELVRRSVRLLGVATARQVADYYRLHKWKAPWREALSELVEEGEVREVTVEGWRGSAYVADGALDGDLTMPDHRPAFLSPLDNLLWDRPRVTAAFGFEHKFEIYVPAERRKFGYYVLPLLVRGQLVGRADLKHDRDMSVLKAVGLWLDSPDVLPDTAVALRNLAEHLGAGAVELGAVHPEAHRAALARLLDA
ncbi:crosslink repair DNA glycosylase YcaQ family protein [Streptomyces sp. NPDC051940]|uniref:winged helix-turn-helix domain-containing protein n=1 Tax=Streptomyces sp. NPDC051940 TaxID=3155675 RepID=UPI003436DD2F